MRIFVTAVLVAIWAQTGITGDYDVVSQGTRGIRSEDGGFRIKMLVEAANLGGDEVEIAEYVFQPNARGRGHIHGSIEIFYVLSGQFIHSVNGKGAVLQPGQIGIVRPGDTVEHGVVGDEPARVLIIWTPGGETERVFGSAAMEPIEKLPLTDNPGQ